MKRFLSVILCICMLATVFSYQVFAADETTTKDQHEVTRKYTEAFNKQLSRGDVTGDNKVTESDAKEYLKVAAKLSAPKENVDYDFTGDSKVTTDDARKALRVVAGLEPAVSDEVLFDYFLDEVNSVKVTFPGFKRTATGTCKSAKITVSGAPLILNSLNCKDMEYVDFIRKNESLLKDKDNPDEYDKMLKEAEELYTPKSEDKIISAGSNLHYTNYPVATLGVSCKLAFEDIEDITFESKDGLYIITITLGDYTYDSDNPYPATYAQHAERVKLPYGKVFNLIEFSEEDAKKLQEVAFKDGKVILTVDSTTGEIINSDYFFNVKTVLKDVSSSQVGSKVYTIEMVTKMEYTFREYFDMTVKA